MHSQTESAPAALISMPWAIFNRPSIQLGALKAYTENTSDMQVACYHLYLDLAKKIGISTYNLISGSGWAGESLFSALLFPEIKERSEHLFIESIGRKSKATPLFSQICEEIQDSLDSWLSSTNWQHFCCLGFSISFNQLLASLYLAARMKQDPRCPPIVSGGSSCTGALGRTLIENFSQINYVVDGEGEIPFVALCRYIDDKSTHLPERIYCRQDCGKKEPFP